MAFLKNGGEEGEGEEGGEENTRDRSVPDGSDNHSCYSVVQLI